MTGKHDFSNKRGLIFGATGFIGSEIAKNLSLLGTNLILHGRSKESLLSLEKKLASFQNNKTFLEFDLGNISLYNKLPDLIAKKTNHIDFFIHAVGKFPGLFPLTHLSSEMWNELIEINLNSHWRALSKIEPFLKKSTAPKIIFFTCLNISSGLPFHNVFSVCQAGIESMYKVFQEENKNLGLKIHLISTKPFNQGMTLSINTENNKNNDKVSVVVEKIIKKCFIEKTEKFVLKI